MPETSTHLLGRLALGIDNRAWETLVERHLEGMRRAAASAAGRDFADDAVQEAFLHVRERARIFRPPPGYDGERAAGAWLRTIAANCALMLARSTRRRRHHEGQEHVMPTSATDEPASSLAATEEGVLLRQALADLSEHERRPIILRYFAGVVEKGQLGAALGCSPDAAGMRLHRAIERLRTRLAKVGVVVALAMLVQRLESAESAGGALSNADPTFVRDCQNISINPSLPALPAHAVIPRPENLLMRFALVASTILVVSSAIGFGLMGQEIGTAPAAQPIVQSAQHIGVTEVTTAELKIGDRVRARGRLLHFDGSLEVNRGDGKTEIKPVSDNVLLCTDLATDVVLLWSPDATSQAKRRELFKPMTRKHVEITGTWLGKTDGDGKAQPYPVLKVEGWNMIADADENTRLHLWRRPAESK